MFNASATELKRIDSITKSPLFTMFSQTIDGLTSIRAHQLEKYFIDTTTHAIDTNTANYLCWAHCNRWLGVRLDFLGSLVILFTALATVQLRDVGYGEAGLLLTYAITVTRTIAVSIRSTTQMEMQFNAAERVKHYTSIEGEEDEGRDGDADVSQSWPYAGEIVWSDVVCR
jgi:ABC-type multidrug transport system fused ATPase/permease subunit